MKLFDIKVARTCVFVLLAAFLSLVCVCCDLPVSIPEGSGAAEIYKGKTEAASFSNAKKDDTYRFFTDGTFFEEREEACYFGSYTGSVTTDGKIVLTFQKETFSKLMPEWQQTERVENATIDGDTMKVVDNSSVTSIFTRNVDN